MNTAKADTAAPAGGDGEELVVPRQRL